jgi:DNA-directed RNA polymerase specialized sigma24 family protein
MSEITRVLNAIERGDGQAAEQLLPLVYHELRKLAAAKLTQELPGQTLQATALVHEAYVRLVDVDQIQGWESRGHFFAAAAEAMRRILIDQARRKHADDLLALDDALQQFEKEEPLKSRLVKLRYFAGLSIEQAAQALGISNATAKRHWVYARTWLYGQVARPLSRLSFIFLKD